MRSRVTFQEKKRRRERGFYRGAGRQGGGVVRGVHPGHGAPEDAQAAGRQAAVVLHTLQPPPHGVPAVVPGVRPLPQEVGDEPVPQGAREGQDDVPETPRRASGRGATKLGTKGHPGRRRFRGRFLSCPDSSGFSHRKWSSQRTGVSQKSGSWLVALAFSLCGWRFSFSRIRRGVG